MNDQTRTPDSITFEERDEFQRNPIAEKLIQLLTSDIDVSPMVIDGHWGTGKTEFCYKLINLLKKTHPDVHVAYVDAFKADHANEPLMTLVAAIANLIADEETEKSFREKAIPALRYGLKTLGKAGIAWVLKKNADEIPDEFEDILQEAAEDSINAAIEQSIKDHQDIEAVLTTLQEALGRIAEDKPLILFIDELDRCKPDFAISMLESIKHVFDVPNIRFVLVSNLNQLKDSINHCYGAGVDAQRYMDKFIKYSFTLADSFTIDKYNYIHASVQHAKLLIEKSKVLSDSVLLKDRVFHLIEILITTNRLSLREVETFVRHLEIWHILNENKGFANNLVYAYALLYILGIYFFCFESEQSAKFLKGDVDANVLVKHLGVSKYVPSKEYDGDQLAYILAAIFFFSSTVQVDGFDLNDREEMGFWRDRIRGLFQDSIWPPDTDDIFPVIVKSIRKLCLDH